MDTVSPGIQALVHSMGYGPIHIPYNDIAIHLEGTSYTVEPTPTFVEGAMGLPFRYHRVNPAFSMKDDGCFLIYNPKDPYSVQGLLGVREDGLNIEWLIEGMNTATEVRLWPCFVVSPYSVVTHPSEILAALGCQSVVLTIPDKVFLDATLPLWADGYIEDPRGMLALRHEVPGLLVEDFAYRLKILGLSVADVLPLLTA